MGVLLSHSASSRSSLASTIARVSAFPEHPSFLLPSADMLPSVTTDHLPKTAVVPNSPVPHPPGFVGLLAHHPSPSNLLYDSLTICTPYGSPQRERKVWRAVIFVLFT